MPSARTRKRDCFLLTATTGGLLRSAEEEREIDMFETLEMLDAPERLMLLIVCSLLRALSCMLFDEERRSMSRDVGESVLLVRDGSSELLLCSRPVELRPVELSSASSVIGWVKGEGRSAGGDVLSGECANCDMPSDPLLVLRRPTKGKRKLIGVCDGDRGREGVIDGAGLIPRCCSIEGLAATSRS